MRNCLVMDVAGYGGFLSGAPCININDVEGFTHA